MTDAPLEAGRIVYVKAWWEGMREVRCRILRPWEGGYYVQPVAGNPHARWVANKNVMRAEPLAPESPCPT